MESLIDLPRVVDSWTARLLEHRLEELGNELRTLGAASDGRSSLEEQVRQFMRRVDDRTCVHAGEEAQGHVVS